VSEEDLAAAMDRTDAYVTTRRNFSHRIVLLDAHRVRDEHGQSGRRRNGHPTRGSDKCLIF
jgi:hypothetical protein